MKTMLACAALAAALAEESIGSRMFGSGMPAASLLAAVRRCGPSVVFLYARLPVDDVRALEEIPRQQALGFTTFVVKPSIFIDHREDHPAFCREVIDRVAALTS